jgi:hypothetical protein
MRLRTYSDPLAEVTDLRLQDILPGLVPDIVLQVYRFAHHRFMTAILAAQRDPERKESIREMFKDAAATAAETGEEETAQQFLGMLGELREEIPYLVRDASGLEMLDDKGEPCGVFRLSALRGEDREEAEEWIFGQPVVRAAILLKALQREVEFQETVGAAVKNSSTSSRTSAGKSPAKSKKTGAPGPN